MLNFKTILSLLAAGTVMIDSPLPRRIISKVVCVVATVVVSAVIIGALLLAATVYAYQLMVTSYGYAPLEASLYILGVMALLSILAVTFTVISIRVLVEVIPKSVKKNVPLTSHLGNEATQVVQAFFQGLIGKTGSQ